MTDTMSFPKTLDEFMQQYKIVDTEQVYTNGTELVPIFRIKQWEDAHKNVVERKKGFWEYVDDMDYRCSNCQKYAYGCLGEVLSGHYKYCPYCGAAMEGEEDDGEEIL